MIRPERVQVMTSLSMMESGKNRANINIARYRRGDFMTQQMVFSFLAGTVCFVAIVGLWIAAHWDNINNIIDMGHPRGVIGKGLAIYGCFMVAYLIMSYCLERRRYTKSHQLGENYLKQLLNLEEMVEKEGASPQMASQDESEENGGTEWPGY